MRNPHRVESWICPFCNVSAVLNPITDILKDHQILFGDTTISDSFSWEAKRCPNPKCRRISLEAEYWSVSEGKHRKWKIRPESSSKTQPDYIPEPIREDYYEACRIVALSPKASATLSRRCLQGMIRDYWDINEKWLVRELDALEERVDPETWDSIKAVKDIATFGAHPERDISLIVPISPHEARVLIELIEQLFDDWYVRRHMRKERAKKIKSIANDKQTSAEKSK